MATLTATTSSYISLRTAKRGQANGRWWQCVGHVSTQNIVSETAISCFRVLNLFPVHLERFYHKRSSFEQQTLTLTGQRGAGAVVMAGVGRAGAEGRLAQRPSVERGTAARETRHTVCPLFARAAVVTGVGSTVVQVPLHAKQRTAVRENCGVSRGKM